MCFVSHISVGENTSNSWECAIKNIWRQSCTVAVTDPDHHPTVGTHHQAHLQLDLRHYGIYVRLCWMWKHSGSGNRRRLGDVLCHSDHVVIWLSQFSPCPPVLPFTLQAQALPRVPARFQLPSHSVYSVLLYTTSPQLNLVRVLWSLYEYN